MIGDDLKDELKLVLRKYTCVGKCVDSLVLRFLSQGNEPMIACLLTPRKDPSAAKRLRQLAQISLHTHSPVHALLVLHMVAEQIRQGRVSFGPDEKSQVDNAKKALVGLSLPAIRAQGL